MLGMTVVDPVTTLSTVIMVSRTSKVGATIDREENRLVAVLVCLCPEWNWGMKCKGSYSRGSVCTVSYALLG